MKSARKLLIVAWLGAACITASGCGDDTKTAPPTSTPTNTATPRPTVTDSPTATLTPTLTATLRPTLTATLPPTATTTSTPSATPSRTATSTSTLTASPTLTATLSPTATHTSTATATASSTLTPTATFTPTFTATDTATPTATVTDTPTETPTPSDTPTTTPTPTVTQTGTLTRTPTVTPTLGFLGIRHFVLNQNKSPFQVKIMGGLTITVGHFQGQTNGQTEAAYLDIEAGQPDANGVTRVNIVKASDFFFVDATNLAQFIVCIKPLIPVMAAGLLACNGGIDSTISLDQDHHVGQLGIDGFTATDCAAKFGHIEIPYTACSAGTQGLPCSTDADCDTSMGADDGACAHFPARCTSGTMMGTVCETDDECGTGGHCGMPHPGVCNGPLIPGIGTGDSGPGSLIIAPNPDPQVQLNGMPIELGFEAHLPCGDEGHGMSSPFALTTGFTRSKVSNANNMLGTTLSFEAQGENFNCQDWQGASLGKLVLSAPAIDQMLVGDVATIFNFASH